MYHYGGLIQELSSPFRVSLVLRLYMQGFEQGGSEAEENSPVDCFCRRGQAKREGGEDAEKTYSLLFLSKPQAWYIITRQRAYLRLDDIQSPRN